MYLVTVSNDELMTHDECLVAQYREKFPLHENFGVRNTRVFRVSSDTDYPVGASISIDKLKKSTNEKDLLYYVDSYLVMCVTYEVSLVNCNEIRALCIEKVNFPKTERVVEYDKRLRILSDLYPEYLVIKVTDSEMEKIQPGEYVMLHDSVLGGRWTVMLEKYTNTSTEFSQYLSNLEADGKGKGIPEETPTASEVENVDSIQLEKENDELEEEYREIDKDVQ